MTGHRERYGLLVAASVNYTCLMFLWFSLPAYLPVVITDVGLTNTQAGVLAGAIPLTYIPLALVSGLAVDRFGPGRTIGGGILLCGFGQVGRSVASTFPSLFLFTLGIGVGATTITFGLPKLVSVLFPPEKTGRPSAIYLIAMMAGSGGVFTVGRPIVGPLLGGWRPLFFWSGVVAVLYGSIWAFVAWRSRIDRTATADREAFSRRALSRDLRVVLTHRELRLVVVIGTMYLFINHGIQGWLPTFLEARGLSPILAGQATGLYIAAYVVGILIAPELADRFRIRRQVLAACGAVVFVGVGGVLLGGSTRLTGIGILVAGLGTGGISPLIRAIPPELEGIGARLTGTAVGFIFAIGEIGGFFGPVLIGVLYDVWGSYALGFGLLSIGGLVVILAGAALVAANT